MSFPSQNTHYCDTQQQQQIQYYKQQSETQAQAEIQYYIYEDLQNIINLIYQRKAVLEYFKNDPTHEMVTLSNNKLILQLNLSSSIHYDQTWQYQKQPELLQFLYNERNKAYQIIDKLIGYNDQTMNMNREGDQIQNYLQQYKNNYATQKFKLNQFQLQQTSLRPQFNENVLSKMISSIQTVDSQVDQIRNSKSYRTPNSYEIKEKAQNYQRMTEGKLKENFPMQNQYNNQIPNNIQKTNTINIAQTSSRIYGQEIKQPLIQSNLDQQPNINNQQNKGINMKERLIEFINCLRYFNVDIIKFQQSSKNNTTEQHFHIKNLFYDLYPKEDFKIWAYNFQRQDLLQQLINLHYYFHLFVEYQRLIENNQRSSYQQTQIYLFISLMYNQIKQDTILITKILEFLFYCKDRIEMYNYLNYISHMTDTTYYADPKQNQEQDYIYQLYGLFYHSNVNNK